MKLVNIEQCLCYDEKTGSIHQVTTGATMNYTHYLSTSLITENYRITDTTLRKKYKTNGVENRDYFYSDNKVLVSESFLKKINVKMKSSSINSKSTNGDLKIPYKRILTKEANEVKNLLINNFHEYQKRAIIQELKEMNWDSFITIATGSFMSQDDWDVAMMKFIDKLALDLNYQNVLAAYSTERSINIRSSVVTKYDSKHRHIHLFLNKNRMKISELKIKKIFLSAINKNSFKRYEYYSEPFKSNMFGENYILKTYNHQNDCFSLVAPQIL